MTIGRLPLNQGSGTAARPQPRLCKPDESTLEGAYAPKRSEQRRYKGQRLIAPRHDGAPPGASRLLPSPFTTIVRWRAATHAHAGSCCPPCTTCRRRRTNP